MSNDLMIPQGFGAPSTHFANTPDDDLGSGVMGGYAVVGYKGRVWAIKKGGETTHLLRENGDAFSSLEVVIVKASPVISKNYYASGFVEGSTAQPDCFSTNGATPDPMSSAPQSATCAGCPMNRFGSRITDNGKPGKACSDSKRLAVVPLGDMENEIYGGPMLLRVPADSLKELPQYAAKLKANGHTSYSVGTRIKFDLSVAHPKFMFSAIRALSDDEAEYVVYLREDPRVARILNEGLEHSDVEAPQAKVEEPLFEQPEAVAAPVVARPAPAARPAAASRPVVAPAAPVAAPPVAPAPVARPAPRVVAPVAAAPVAAAAVKAPPRPPARPAPRPAPVAAAPVVEEAVNDDQVEGEASAGFEDELDAQLAALLPPAA